MPASRTVRDPELLAIANFSGITATTLLNFVGINGSVDPSVDLGNIDISSIILESEVTAISGTTPTLRVSVLTSNKQAIDATSANALQGDGSTQFQTPANQTAVGTVQVGLAPQAASGATSNNIGKYLGLRATVGGTTPVISGQVRLYVKGK